MGKSGARKRKELSSCDGAASAAVTGAATPDAPAGAPAGASGAAAAAPSSSDESSDEESVGLDDDQSDDEDDKEMEMMNAEFDSVAAQKEDFHGIKTLLTQLFRLAPVNTVDLADLVIEQCAIGCLLKQVQDDEGESDDTGATEPAAAAAAGDQDGAAAAAEADAVNDANVVYALVSALSLKAHAKRDGVQSLIKWMSSKLGAEHGPTMAKILTSRVAFILSERFLNIPLQVAPLMYQALQEDMSGDAGADAGFPVDHYVLVIKTVEMRAPQVPIESRKGKGKRRRTAPEVAVQFCNPEDELLEQHATLYHTFDADDSKEAAMSDVRHKRTIVVLTAKALSAFLADVRKAVPLADGSYHPLNA